MTVTQSMFFLDTRAANSISESTVMTNEIKSVSARPNGWEDAKLFFNDKLIEGPIMLWRGQVHDIRVEVPSSFTGQISLTKEDSRDLAITASPEFGTPADPVGNAFRWKVTSVEDGKSGNIFLVFSSKDVITEWRVPCVVRSDYVGDDWGFTLWDDPLPAEKMLIRKSIGIKLHLVNKTGVDFNWEALRMSKRVFPPLVPADVEIFSGGDEWIANGYKNTGGRFELIFEEEGIPKPLTLHCLLLAEELEDEGRIKVGGEDIAADGYVFFRDQPVSITFEPNPGSLINEVQMWLTGKANSPLLPGDIRSMPEFGVKQTGKYEWDVTGSNRSGTLVITLRGGNGGTGFGAAGNYLVNLPGKLLSRNLEDEVDVLIDGKEPVEGMKFVHDVTYFLTLRLKPGSPLGGHALQLHCAGLEGFNPGDLKCEPGFDRPITSNYLWLLTGLQGSGRFQLSLSGEGMEKAIDLPIYQVGE